MEIRGAAALLAAPPAAAPAAVSARGRSYVGHRPLEMWDDEEANEPEYNPALVEDFRRQFIFSPPIVERPGSLAVIPPAATANVPAAGMPSGGGSTTRNVTYAQILASAQPARSSGAQAAGAQSAAGTLSGSSSRRASQLTDKGSPMAAASAPPATAPVVSDPAPARRRFSRPVQRRYGPAVVRRETSPGGTIYEGFTPPHILTMEDDEDDSDPEPDVFDDAEFDVDQPAHEHHDVMRYGRGPYF